MGIQSQIHEGEGRIHTGHPPSQPLDVRPHTGSNQLPEPVDITSAGGFPINEGQPQIYITPVPDAKDLRDYILITPIPALPVVYVYLSESAGDNSEEKPKNIKMLDDKYLKDKGVDAHEIQSEFLGSNAEIKNMTFM
ncbi:S-type pyocin domain-containing protein [Providencia stuartii]|uniref:S-type pyocin domain-containing protein n=1 Tax=Providencia stuartii TaxID=588 RepID=UPI001F5B034B|nr:S-type pyocin domain-containing protein [Providencia stuartii]